MTHAPVLIATHGFEAIDSYVLQFLDICHCMLWVERRRETVDASDECGDDDGTFKSW